MRHGGAPGDAAKVLRYADGIRRILTRPWTVMEICGAQTETIVRHGIDQLLPDGLSLMHGPGSAACVTPASSIDAAVSISLEPGVVLCAPETVLRLPGNSASLLAARVRGADVRTVESPLDALAIARAARMRQVVYLAVGFEMAAPATATAVVLAERQGVANFSVLVAHARMPPVLQTLLGDHSSPIQGFLMAESICSVMGTREYEPVAAQYGVPIVVSGSEPVELWRGLYFCVRQLEAGSAEVENQAGASVRREGNRRALDLLRRVFAVRDQNWRGMGDIASSGLCLAPHYARFDAMRRFRPVAAEAAAPGECLAGPVLHGLSKPAECAAFAIGCTPQRPLGTLMIAQHAACAVYYRYRGRPAR